MKRVKTFRFSEADLAVLDALSGVLGGVSEAECLRALLAEGLRHRMEHGDPPVHPHFTEGLRPEAVAEAYLDYIDAVYDYLLVKRPDGTAPTHYFAQVPAGGFNLGLVMRKLMGRGTPRGFQGLAAALRALHAAWVGLWGLWWVFWEAMAGRCDWKPHVPPPAAAA